MPMRFDHYLHLAGAQILEDILADLADHRSKLDRILRYQEMIMASTTRLETAVAAVLAEVARLKATQEDPATQVKLDELAGQLEGALPPPTP